MIHMNCSDDALSGLIAAPHLFSTIHVGLVDVKTGEVVEALYDCAAKFHTEISHGMETFHTEKYPTNDLMHYFELPDNLRMEASIREKIRSAHITVEASGEILFARLDLDMVTDLTNRELAVFAAQIQSQYKDGWGAEFELQNIPAGKDAVCLRLWHDGIAFFVGTPREQFEWQSYQRWQDLRVQQSQAHEDRVKEESGMSEEALPMDSYQKLCKRMEASYQIHYTGWMELSPSALIEQAKEIAALQDTREYMAQGRGIDPEGVDYLLTLADPLQAVADHWLQRMDDLSDFSFALDELCRRRNAPTKKSALAQLHKKAAEVPPKSHVPTKKEEAR